MIRLAHFTPDAPLVRSLILKLVTEGSAPRPTLLAHALRLDEQITSLLLGDEALDRRLARCCRYVQSAPGLSELALPDDTRAALALLASRAVAAGEPLRLYLHGPRGGGKALIAAALAASVRFPLLEIELAQLLEIPSDFDRLLPLAMREGWLHGAVVHLRQADLVLRDGPVLQRVQLCDAIARQPGITILSGVRPWVPSTAGLAGVVEVPQHVPDVPQRRVLWQRTLSRAGGVPLSADCLDTLAARF